MQLFIPSAMGNKPVVDLCSDDSELKHSSFEFLNAIQVHEIDTCDAILYPHDINDWKREDFQRVLSFSKKKLVLYFNRSDFPISTFVPNAISIQHSIYPSGPDRPIVVVPYRITSLEFLPLRDYKYLPTVSFVGYVPKLTVTRFMRSLKLGGKDFRLYENASIRKVGLTNLKKDFPDTLILARSQYGGARSLVTPIEFQRNRNEFFESVANSDIVFCPRGDANSSIRFFEAISAGRIPLIPDSNIFLPKLPILDYSHFLIKTDLYSRNAYSNVWHFWATLDARTYLEKQLFIRACFSKYLTYESYLKRVLMSRISELPKYTYCKSQNLTLY